MPDIAVHASMGRKVYKELHMKLNMQVFRFGLLGPDPFLFSLPHYYKYSSIMHRKYTGAFLLELTKSARSLDDFSFLCGFLCHYALDSNTHPFVVGLSRRLYGDNWKGSMMHIAIEHRLDAMEGRPGIIPPFPPASVISYFSQAVRKVYGWKNAARMFKIGYDHMPAFYYFVKDDHGVMNKLFGWTKGPAAMISSKSSICDNIDLSGFRPLYDKSIKDAISFIRCAWAFKRKEIGESEFTRIIGDRPYI